MGKRRFINALLAIALAAAFYFFFMFTKHDAALGKIIPFANGPYDAIGSFAVETTLFLSLLSCVRSIRLYRGRKQEAEQQVFLARTQMGIVLTVLLTLIGDIVAMIRHLSQWTGQSATTELLLMLVGMAILTLITGIVVFFSVHTPGQPRPPFIYQWGVVLLLGICIGLLLVMGESTEGGRGLPSFQFFRHLQVVFVYIGLEVSAVLIGYSFLSKQLGLFRGKA